MRDLLHDGAPCTLRDAHGATQVVPARGHPAHPGHSSAANGAGPSAAADIAADLLGPDLKFHHAKLNYKWHSGGEAVSWHQVTRRPLVT